MSDNFQASMGGFRLLVEHTDRKGQVSLVPLSRDMQAILLAEAGKNADCRVCAPAAANDMLRTDRDDRRLTAREIEVLDLLVQGMRSKQIAYVLQISVRTVELHRARIMRKRGARNVAALVRMTCTAA